MPWLVQLIEGASSSTVDLNDGTTYSLNVKGFWAPPPSRRLSMAGGNFYRHGSDMLARVYDNRTVSVNLSIEGTDATALATAVRNIWTILRKAEEFQRQRVGTLVQLKYQWTGAPSPVYFNVIEGVLDLGQDAHSPYLLKGTRIQNATVELLCEPFAMGTAETVVNYLADPSFEVAGSALADWTKTDGTGTNVRTTASSKYGTAAGETRRTAGTADNGISQDSTGFASGTRVSAGVWANTIALTSGMTARLRITDGTVTIGTALLTATNTAFTLMKVENINFTGAGAGTGTSITYVCEIIGGTGTGTVRWDGCILTTGSALPTAWVSGRNLANHFDDNGQKHINYVDLYNVPGDVPAALQIVLNGGAQWNEVWVGARHAGRAGDSNLFLEAENMAKLSGTGGLVVIAGGTYSNSSAATMDGLVTTAADAFVGTWALATPPVGQYRVLAQMLALTSDVYVGIGYSYGAVTLLPTATANFVRTTATGGSMQVYDLGVLMIPPIDTPGSSTIGTFEVRIKVMGSAASSTLVMDYLHLMPVDKGMVYASGTMQVSGTGNVLVDSTSKPPGIYFITTADVVRSFPANQVGSAPEAHPQGNRFYVLHTEGGAGGTPTGSANVRITYTPRFLHV